jgi:hypothetical protein
MATGPAPGSLASSPQHPGLHPADNRCARGPVKCALESWGWRVLGGGRTGAGAGQVAAETERDLACMWRVLSQWVREKTVDPAD